MKRAFSEDSAESSSPQEAASYTRRHAEERGGSHEPPRDKKRHLNSVKIKRPKIFAKRESSCSRATSGFTRNSYRARPEWNDSEDDSSDSDASGGEFAAQIGESRGKTKIKKKKSPSHQEKMQVVRTMQLLNALLKQQKNHAMQYSTLNDARLDPTALAVSYENMLTQVHKKHASLEDSSSDEVRGEEGLTWAAALILAIPPSILAILLAQHIAKRQLQPRGAPGGPGGLAVAKGRFGGLASDLEMDSESSSEGDFLRAEGEAQSYAEYHQPLSALIRRPGRLLGGPPARQAPRLWLHGPGGGPPGYYGRHGPRGPYGYPELLEGGSPLLGYRQYPRPFPHAAAAAAARPPAHEFAEADELSDAAWAAAPGFSGHPQELFMHGGL